MILGLNTLLSPISMSLIHEGRCLLKQEWPGEGRALEDLPLYFAQFLEKAGSQQEDLTGIAVVNGPGPYTGIRLGIGFAKTLSQVLEIPCHGVSSLEALLPRELPEKTLIFSVLPLRKGLLNAQGFSYSEGGLKQMTSLFTWTIEDCITALKKFQEPVIFCHHSSQIELYETLSALSLENLRLMPSTLDSEAIAKELALNLAVLNNKNWRQLSPLYSPIPVVTT